MDNSVMEGLKIGTGGRSMSERSVKFIRRAAKKVLSDNHAAVGRKKLCGSLFTRERACKKAADIVALTRLNKIGREWGGRSEVDKLTFSLRATATDVRSTADMRITALEKLCVLDGLMPIDALGQGAEDTWIRQIVAPKPVLHVVQPTSQAAESAGITADLLDFSGVGT